jgi:hypothetical protein
MVEPTDRHQSVNDEFDDFVSVPPVNDDVTEGKEVGHVEVSVNKSDVRHAEVSVNKSDLVMEHKLIEQIAIKKLEKWAEEKKKLMTPVSVVKKTDKRDEIVEEEEFGDFQ